MIEAVQTFIELSDFTVYMSKGDTCHAHPIPTHLSCLFST